MRSYIFKILSSSILALETAWRWIKKHQKQHGGGSRSIRNSMEVDQEASETAWRWINKHQKWHGGGSISITNSMEVDQ